MYENQFVEYLKSLSSEMQVSKDRIRLLIGDGHWQTDGEHKEAVLRKLIRSVIPNKLSICRGFMVTHRNQRSGQIDILILDRMNKPVLFQDDELVVTTPDCVRGIIEVKTKIRSVRQLEEVLTKLGDHIKLQNENSNEPAFGGLFVYEDSRVSDENILQALHSAAQSDEYRAVNWISFGSNRFFRYWPLADNPVANPAGNSVWHSYNLVNLAQAYFISNVMWDVSGQPRNNYFGVEHADKVWFPIPEGKEYHKNGSIGLKEGMFRPE